MPSSVNLKFDITKTSDAPNTFRAQSVRGRFDLQSNKVIEKFAGELALPEKWNVGLIYGASGTGKSTIARHLWPKDVIDYTYGKKTVVDEMPEARSVEEITGAFNSVGFATVWSWLKPYGVLSTGEKMRVDVARSILEQRDLIVFDEYTSVVNREVAKAGSFALAKAMRKMDRKFIAVTCHSDVLEWLNPDWVFRTDDMTFARRSLQRIKIKLEIHGDAKRFWPQFRKHHYLNTNLHPAAQCWLATIEGRAVGFFAVLRDTTPHGFTFKNQMRGHRLVVLPDYQGLGIGHALSSEVAQHYRNKGWRFRIVSSTQSLFKQRARDPRWVVLRAGRMPSMRTLGDREQSQSGSKNTFTYEFIGKGASVLDRA